ncbi:hypothetical protein E2C01_100069 [Portunus trituberculatus]|uniref:Uncharacterized protein n=1 Tax=Portunus trituberculatus TaxID=210409 RepID=A0A5B7KCC9_PORTR|nr:hypothetical protein [Portunus trituberculatus]
MRWPSFRASASERFQRPLGNPVPEEVSIKNAERDRRAKVQPASQLRVTQILSEGQNVPSQWKKYLSCEKNKELLMEFFIKS